MRSISRTSWSATTSASIRRSTLRTSSRRRSPPSRMLYVATRIRAAWCFLARDIDRTYNATVQPQRDAHLTELVFLDRGPIALRCIAVVIAAAACGVAGTLLVRLHQTLAGAACRARRAQPAADTDRDRVNRAHALARVGGGALLRRSGPAPAPRRHRATARADRRRASDPQPSCAPGCAASTRSSGSRSSSWCSSPPSMLARTIASLIAAQSGRQRDRIHDAGDGRRGARVRRGRARACRVGTQLRHRGAPPRRAVSDAALRSAVRRRSRRRARASSRAGDCGKPCSSVDASCANSCALRSASAIAFEPRTRLHHRVEVLLVEVIPGQNPAEPGADLAVVQRRASAAGSPFPGAGRRRPACRPPRWSPRSRGRRRRSGMPCRGCGRSGAGARRPRSSSPAISPPP